MAASSRTVTDAVCPCVDDAAARTTSSARADGGATVGVGEGGGEAIRPEAHAVAMTASTDSPDHAATTTARDRDRVGDREQAMALCSAPSDPAQVISGGLGGSRS